MKVAVSTIGKVHTFELARELHRQDAVAAIFSGYPRFKLKHEQLPGRLIKTYPWIHTPYMIPRLRNALGTRAIRAWELLDRASLDRQLTLRAALSEAATARVRALGGWSDYGNRAMKIYSDLAGQGTRAP
jgi:hypothetical protein